MEPSIVDQILNFDELEGTEVRRAERAASFCLRADLEGEIDVLEQQLALLTDERGNLTGAGEAAVGETPEAVLIARKIESLQEQMRGAMRSVLFRQLPEAQWTAFREKHSEVFESEEWAKGFLPPEVYFELIVLSACKPKITEEELDSLRAKFGVPVLDQLAAAAIHCNLNSGVSVPKSRRSSAVLARAMRSTS